MPAGYRRNVPDYSKQTVVLSSICDEKLPKRDCGKMEGSSLRAWNGLSCVEEFRTTRANLSRLSGVDFAHSQHFIETLRSAQIVSIVFGSQPTPVPVLCRKRSTTLRLAVR